MFIFFFKWGGSWVKKNIVMCCGIALVMKPHRITVISNATFKKHGRSKKKKKIKSSLKPHFTANTNSIQSVCKIV